MRLAVRDVPTALDICGDKRQSQTGNETSENPHLNQAA